ncbi:NADPH:quinone reductase-like Zn-dependent oxidoreductase [Allocatelliglobosispora scoriae]|uniref:NADPH:quinone reductase-like Zn-dependent oxidoreductase n=1 Tax=Allocatelliglobosispora scoriae TaxID=643052 RepID=A0A841BJF9_9ACTN|nr:zinc-binding dehydrogenase [Allocatelliglobosispora scoriae]MBB5867765.1 NADPH:quinone reductase-like Zn-dependent oxidoreductase [Allocatelliglobosispora scoriae]
MLAVYATTACPQAPLDALGFGEQPEPVVPDAEWAVVTVRSAALNHHDLWTLRGSGLMGGAYPRILGCEAAGVDDTGRPVILASVHTDPQWRHDPVRDPRRAMIGETLPGTFAERVAVPRHLLVDRPGGFTDAEAACVAGTFLTAYRMLFTKSRLRPGDTVLIQGATGGVSSALIRLAAAGGFQVWVTGRTAAKRDHALALGAHRGFPPGSVPANAVDAVMESVGEATWAQSLRAARPGGTIVVTGATTGANPPAYLGRIFDRELTVTGSSGGTVDELHRLIAFMQSRAIRPDIDVELPFAQAREGMRRMADGEARGKVVFSW